MVDAVQDGLILFPQMMAELEKAEPSAEKTAKKEDLKKLEDFFIQKILHIDYQLKLSFYQFLYQDRTVKVLDQKNNCSLQINFDEDKKNYFRKNTQGKKDLFMKALGLKKNQDYILDLSAGLGRDAVFLASQTINVLALERDPMIYFLLSSAKILSQRNDLSSLKFTFIDSADYFHNFFESNFHAKDLPTLYYDPMYPEENFSSALPKKEIQFLRKHVGPDLDHEELLTQLLCQGKMKFRIVVKRHPSFKSTFLPDIFFEGKSVRFDVFLPDGKVAQRPC